MSSFCPTHGFALDPDDRDWCFEVSRNYREHDGSVEHWHCPLCDYKDTTKMYKGRRLSVPDCVVVTDEHD